MKYWIFVGTENDVAREASNLRGERMSVFIPNVSALECWNDIKVEARARQIIKNAEKDWLDNHAHIVNHPYVLDKIPAGLIYCCNVNGYTGELVKHKDYERLIKYLMCGEIVTELGIINNS